MFDSFQEYHFDGERSITGIMPKIVILEDSGSTPGVHTTLNEGYYSMKDTDYVVVTAISSYRMRYVMHRDDLPTTSDNGLVSIIDRANNVVAKEECEEFSQAHIGEYIVDTVEMNEAEMLALFDKDNDYLRDWPRSKVVAMVRDLNRFNGIV